MSRTLDNEKKAAQSRVPLDEYVKNLKTFADQATSVGINVAFLSRPHRETTEELKKNVGWRSRVPEYNQALRDCTSRNSYHLIDIQRHFEQKTEQMFVEESHFNEVGIIEMSKLLEGYLIKSELL